MCETSAGVTIEPPGGSWRETADRAVATRQSVWGRALTDWIGETRRVLRLESDRPILATGHQTLLWHPGILAKFIATDRVVRATALGSANLVVDQHVGGFDGYDVPVRPAAGGLAVRRVRLGTVAPDVPMGLHPPLDPGQPDVRDPALPSVTAGVTHIHDAIKAHRHAASAATQMTKALGTLMEPWVGPMPAVTATQLIATPFAERMLEAMVGDPEACVRAYNAAIRQWPEAGIGPLVLRDDLAELPVWRIDEDGRRRRADDADVARALETRDTSRLLPRALFMTALVRLVMCDLFVHGLGGANYDRAMVSWIERWLGVTPAPVAVVTATVLLPLPEAEAGDLDLGQAARDARRTWHDPEAGPDRPGAVKRELLAAIDDAPRGSARRRAAFFALHRELDALRAANVGRVETAQRRYKDARRHRREHAIATRRDWPFPLYPVAEIDRLAARIEEQCAAARM